MRAPPGRVKGGRSMIGEYGKRSLGDGMLVFRSFSAIEKAFPLFQETLTSDGNEVSPVELLYLGIDCNFCQKYAD